MQTLIERLSEALSLGLFESRLLASVLMVVLLFAARPLLMAIVGRRTSDVSALYRWRKVFEYSSLVIGLIALAEIWLVGARSVATYLGLLSAGLAIALKDPISNIFGWLFVITRRPFEVGDRIEIDGVAGDVIDVRYFQFTLVEIGNWVDADQSTGRIIHVPNQKVFLEPVANFTRGFGYIWNEIVVTVTFESDWRRAKAILTEVVTEHTTSLSEAARDRLREAARRYLISYDKLTPIVYTKVGPSGVSLTMRYLCDPRQRRGTEMAVWEAVLEAFDEEPQIELAYPTQRFYFRGGDEAPVDGREHVATASKKERKG
jgi:small-conductance mechanosensitive channel